MENKREITREIEGRTIKGFVEKVKTGEGVKYIYSYPELEELGRKLKIGDYLKISERLKCSQQYVQQVLSGEKFNKSIVELAEKLASIYERIDAQFEECFGTEE